MSSEVLGGMLEDVAALTREYEALMERCDAGVLVLDADGVVLRANATASHLLGSDTPSLLGRSLLHNAVSRELDELFRLAKGEMRLQRRELGDVGPRDYALIVSVAPIAPCTPAECRFIVIVHDVTELRRLETIRRDFVANVSHELRTPLASIRAMAETLQDGAMNDPSVADSFLGTIVTEAQRLTRISEDLLILSRAESGRPEKKPFNLSALLAEVVARFQPQAEKAGLRLDSAVAKELRVRANHDQIEQVVVNLVDNALKYTPAGGKVCVAAAREGNGVRVSVKDTGIGILPEDQPRIFERFYRVDKARSRQSGGTGLGLSIVKHIVEAHGGTVGVESVYGEGSTFSFMLPDEDETAP